MVDDHPAESILDIVGKAAFLMATAGVMAIFAALAFPSLDNQTDIIAAGAAAFVLGAVVAIAADVIAVRRRGSA